MAIAFVINSGNALSGTTTLSGLTSGTGWTSGDCGIIAIAARGSGGTVTSVTDNVGNVWSKINATTAGSGTTKLTLSLWSTTVNGSKASANASAVFTGAPTECVGVIGLYSGVVFEGTNVTNNGSSGTETITQTVAASTSWSVACIAQADGSTYTASSGNLREHIASGSSTSGVNIALNDNTGSTSLTNAVTSSHSSANWLAIAVQFNLTVPGNIVAQGMPVFFMG